MSTTTLSRLVPVPGSLLREKSTQQTFLVRPVSPLQTTLPKTLSFEPRLKTGLVFQAGTMMKILKSAT